MTRGTTPTLEFELPFDTALLAEAWVTLAQSGKEILSKELVDCTCEGNLITVRLTQEETLRLDQEHSTEIQLRVRTWDGEAFASRIYTVDTARILKEGVI